MFNKNEFDKEPSRIRRAQAKPILPKNWLKNMIIIKHKSKFSGFLRLFNVLCCLVSSYVYMWYCAFEDHSDGWFYHFQIYIELIFFFMMTSKFQTDFIIDGDQTSTTDLLLIAKHYVKTDFVWDLIPLLPFPFFLRHLKN